MKLRLTPIRCADSGISMDDLLLAVQSSKLRRGKGEKKAVEEVNPDDARAERLMMMAFRMGQSSSNADASSSGSRGPVQPGIPALGIGNASSAPVEASKRRAFFGDCFGPKRERKRHQNQPCCVRCFNQFLFLNSNVVGILVSRAIVLGFVSGHGESNRSETNVFLEA